MPINGVQEDNHDDNDDDLDKEVKSGGEAVVGREGERGITDLKCTQQATPLLDKLRRNILILCHDNDVRDDDDGHPHPSP